MALSLTTQTMTNGQFGTFTVGMGLNGATYYPASSQLTAAGTIFDPATLAMEGGNLATIAAACTSSIPTGGNQIGFIYASTPQQTGSVTVSAAAIAAHISAVASQYSYCSGFQITGGGATTASVIACTLTGIIGGTSTYYVAVPTLTSLQAVNFQVQFVPALQSSAVNTLIQINVASFGSGNVQASVTMQGYTSPNAFPMP